MKILLCQMKNHLEQCRKSQAVQCNGKWLPQKDDCHKLLPSHVRRSGKVAEKIIRRYRQKNGQCK